MSQKHGTPLRGLMSAKNSPLFQGRFGRMFRSLPSAQFGATDAENIANLTKLGQAMSAGFDPPKDGKDDEESGIPALYTYFGQFIDHDLTFDPASSLQKQDDPDALTDFRTAAFDLDNVYGRGPDDQPYLYDGGNVFLKGTPLKGGNDPNATDLPRNNANPSRALIGDPRNDENSIVSQLQGLFLRFHNRTLADNPNLPFPKIQKLVRFHYQYVILNDFLPRIIHSSVLADLKTNGHFDQHRLKFFHWKNEPFMPVEFSVAGYRLGHSMIRPGYRLNDAVLRPIFPVPSPPADPPGLLEGLTGFRAMNSNWGIDWGRFIDIDIRTYDGSSDENKKRLQFAYRIDTSLVNPLSNLPPSVASNPSSLPARNLLRGWHMGLPSGQQVAEAMGVEPLQDKDIRIGKGVDQPAQGEEPMSITTISSTFANNCPLWTYVLAEAMAMQETVKVPVKETVSITTPRLGPVGGRIVAEVFLGLMFGDNHSLLSLAPNWQPKGNPNYALKDLVKYAVGEQAAPQVLKQAV
jgi:heme peroxidase